MRQKRAKAYKKQMNVYLHTFKFREPFQTIVDADLVVACHGSSFDIEKGLNRTIQGETKPMITQCCMEALYKTKDQAAIEVGKKFERRRCNHREAIDPNECIESITIIKGENKHRYIVAAQNYELRKLLRKTPGVPLVYMNRSVMVMEPLSDASGQYSVRFENKKLTAGLNDSRNGKEPKEHRQPKEVTEASKEAPQPKKRRGASEPNPLSIKRRKQEAEEPKEGKAKRRRKHKSAKEGEEEGHTEEVAGLVHTGESHEADARTESEVNKPEVAAVPKESGSD